MSSDHSTGIIMFSDIAGSSALYKRMGNVDAKRMIDNGLEVMSAIIVKQSGFVVKTIGDEVMSRFDDCNLACQASIEIQHECQKIGLPVRIGMNYGDIILDQGDVFGDTVNNASSVSHIAKGEQTLITEYVYEKCIPALKNRCQIFDKLKLKGEDTKTTVYRLQWEDVSEDLGATTMMSFSYTTQTPGDAQLVLQLNGADIQVSADHTPYIIGRDQNTVNMHINHSLASRNHCQIVFRHGKYVLIDNSTNGTYVGTPEHKEIYLRREELPLTGRGTIAIGQPAANAEELLIRYII